MPLGSRHARPGAPLFAPALYGTRCQGRPIDRTVSDFHARVVQHEVDHLDGILYPQRIRDLTQFGFTDTLFPDFSSRTIDVEAASRVVKSHARTDIIASRSLRQRAYWSAFIASVSS